MPLIASSPAILSQPESNHAFRARAFAKRIPSVGAFDNAAYYVALFFLLLNTAEGAVRYALYSLGLEMLLYVRDLLMVGVIAWFLIKGFRTRSLSKPLTGLVLVVSAWSVVGLKYVHNVSQVAFGIKLFLPFMFGIVLGPLFFAKGRETTRWLAFFWFLAVAGIFCNTVVAMPWTGMRYEIGDVQLQGAREWTIDGMQRLGGISRGSIDASLQILFFAIYLGCFARSRLSAAAVWVISVPAIVLTTDRAALIGFAVASVFILLCRLQPALQCVWKHLVTLVVAATVILPLVPSATYRSLLTTDLGGMGKLTSFFERSEEIWPEAFELLESSGNLLIGRGLGGLGAPQKLFEPEAYNPGDNLFVSLYVLFGVISLAILGYVLIRLHWISIRDAKSLFTVAAGLAFFTVGMLLNLLDNSCAAVFAGICLYGMHACRARHGKVVARPGGASETFQPETLRGTK